MPPENLTIRRRNWLAKPLSTQEQAFLPFRASVRDRKLRVSVPTYFRVGYERNGFCRWLHLGSRWTELGITATAVLDFDFPFGTRIVVGHYGRQWVVRWQGVETAAQSNWTGDESRWLGASVGLHAGVLLLALAWLTVGGLVGRRASHGTPPRPVVSQPRASFMTLDEAPAFSGVTYSEFLRESRMENPEQRLKRLSSRLQNLSMSAGAFHASNGFSNSLGVSSPDVGIASPDTLTEKLAKVPVVPVRHAPVSIAANDERVAIARKKFEALQAEFQRAYSRLLSRTPGLSATVDFEVKVLPNGYLRLASFRSRTASKGSEAGLSMLRQAMASIIENTYLDTGLAGISLRAETVFVR